ncbi:50S ribosome-binding GTPase [Nocardiopsis sp. CNT-189]|uniref:GTPase n=1 Tax=Nocardiopsis oceanisediminis TaxID=2816862 RepID=UPI003B34421F
MTSQRNPAHTGEEPDAPEGAGQREEAPRAASDGWSGYIVPTAGADAGWLPREGGGPLPPARSGPDRSYPELRRAVDERTGDGGGDGEAEQGPWPTAEDGPERQAAEPPAADADGGADAGSEAAAGAEPSAPARRGRHAAPRRAEQDPGPAEAPHTGSAHERPDGGPASPEGPEGPEEDAGAPAPAQGQGAAAGDMDDPEDLAGWVGSLTEAVDADTRIAGRRTGEIPIVRPQPEPAAEDAGSGAGTDAGGAAEPERPEPAGTGSADAGLPEPEPAGAEPFAGPSVEEEPEAGAPEEHGAEEDGGTGAEPDDGPAPWTPDPGFTVDGADGDDDEYRPDTREHWQPHPEVSRAELVARLDGLAAAVEIGGEDIAPERAAAARHMLNHAGARLRLSADHTVVALAGGTGSGKSSLFNAVCGLEFSRVGITRPTTSAAHACVWGTEGADELLDWVGVPPRHRHSRTSELDRDDSELSGLILLDLPDHDSVRAVHTAEADRLIGAADLLVWVLDPQKYADAAVHHRYLAEMSGYGAVTVAVLNQVDRVEPDELEELLTDLRRLLETESGVHPRVLTTSTLTGHGIRDLRELLTETVAGRRAAVDRLVADLEGVVEEFEPYRSGEGSAPEEVPEPDRRRLAARLLEACGTDALADAVETRHARRGTRRVGWPVTRWASRFRRDPVRAAGMDFLRDSSDAAASPVAPQQAEVEKAAVATADAVAGGLPAPWPKRLRAAARSGTEGLPEALGSEVAAVLPSDVAEPSWWGAVRALQYTLVAAAGAALAWFAVVLVSWLAGGLTGLAFLDSPLFLGLAAAVAAAALLAGWLTSIGCRNLVSDAAAKEREATEAACAERVEAVAEEQVIAPVERELARYRSFEAALAEARGEA